MKKKSSPKKTAAVTRTAAPRKIAFAGLGDMGLPMAKNLLRGGFAVCGFDPRAERTRELAAAGGTGAKSCREAARGAEAAFVMVMNGAQMEQAVCGRDGILSGLRPGAALFITATVERADLIRIAPTAAKRRVVLIDSPVSGGQHGAIAAKLTFMAAGKPAEISAREDILRAMGAVIHIVGEKPGDGQTVKAVLQGLVGGAFASAFESLAFGAKAGIHPRVLEKVFTTSVAASPLLANCVRLVLERKFKGTGSNIATMRKDLGIATGLAREVGAPVFVAAAARELFQAGATKFSGEDNWAVVKILEDITGVKVDGRQKKSKSGPESKSKSESGSGSESKRRAK